MKEQCSESAIVYVLLHMYLFGTASFALAFASIGLQDPPKPELTPIISQEYLHACTLRAFNISYSLNQGVIMKINRGNELRGI